MKNFLKRIIFLILIASFFCCKKDQTVETVQVSNDLYDYAVFKPGTKWIYEDTVSNKFDTVDVLGLTEGIDTVYKNNGDIDFLYKYYFMTTYSSNDMYFYNYTVDGHWKKIDGYYVVWREKVKPGDYAGSTFLMAHPIAENIKFYPYTQQGAVYLSKIVSYYYDSVTINNVFVFHDEKNITEKEQPTDFYIAPHFGVVKKILKTDSIVWQLKSSFIIQ